MCVFLQDLQDFSLSLSFCCDRIIFAYFLLNIVSLVVVASDVSPKLPAVCLVKLCILTSLLLKCESSHYVSKIWTVIGHGCMLKILVFIIKKHDYSCIWYKLISLVVCSMLCFAAGQRSFEMNITVPLFMYDSEWGIMGLINGE